MSLAHHLDNILRQLKPELHNEALAGLLDLTLLNSQAEPKDILALYEQGEATQVAALCVLPEHLAFIPNTSLRLATVMNFPEGHYPSEEVLKAIDAIKHRAQEIDYVFPYQAYLQGQRKAAIEACSQIVAYAHQSGLIVKIIMESGAFSNLELLYQASREIIDSGCDFIKTSTGKISQGASLSAAFSMLSAIKDSDSPCGIKFSGGIRTSEQAWQYLALVQRMFDKRINSEWLRFGSSSILS